MNLDAIAAKLLPAITSSVLTEKVAVTLESAERVMALSYAGAVRVKKVVENMKVECPVAIEAGLSLLTARLHDQKLPVTPDLVEVMAVWSLHAASSKLPAIRESLGLLAKEEEPAPVVEEEIATQPEIAAVEEVTEAAEVQASYVEEKPKKPKAKKKPKPKKAAAAKAVVPELSLDDASAAAAL